MSDSIVCPVSRHAADAPDTPAIITDGQSITYAELDVLATAFEQWIDEEDGDAGSVLAVRGDTSPEFLALLVAALRRGAVFAPLSTRLPDALVEEQSRIVGAWRTVDPRTIAVTSYSLEDRETAVPRWRLDGQATAIFTSGSTGQPRAVVLSVRNHVVSAEGSQENIPLKRGDRWLLSLPMFHVGGLAIAFRCFLHGASIVVSGRAAGDAIETHGVTHVSFVPTQLQRLLDSPGERPQSLRAVLLGGSQIPSVLMDQALEAGLPIHASYGLTEMASQVATTRPGAPREELRTAGFVLPGREVRIDPNGRIHVRGGTRFLGFLNGATLELPFDSDGWYQTGDLGHIDDEGRLVVLGRGDQVFISGGENIHPAQIERALLELPGIRDAVVVPIEESEYGFRPVAFIDSAERCSLETVRKALAELLPRFMLPVALFELPKPSGLKHDRAHLARIARRDRHVAP